MKKPDISRERWLELATKAEDGFDQDEIDEMLRSGDVVECSACGRLSAFAWELANAYKNSDGSERSYYDPLPDMVAHVPAASGFDFQCGHCRLTNVHRDSPTLADCYTHAGDR